MPQFIVAYRIEADSADEIRRELPYEADELLIAEDTNKPTDDYMVPMDHACLICLGNEQFVLGRVTGWCVDSFLFSAARHLPFPTGERVMHVTAQSVENKSRTQAVTV